MKSRLSVTSINWGLGAEKNKKRPEVRALSASSGWLLYPGASMSSRCILSLPLINYRQPCPSTLTESSFSYFNEHQSCSAMARKTALG